MRAQEAKSYFAVKNPGQGGRLRFETLYEAEAIKFAQDVYRDEKIIVEIAEVPR